MTARGALDLTVQTSLSSEEKALAPPRRMIRAWARAALLEGPAEVAIRLVGEAEGHELNLTYRGKDYATNVLTFAYGVADLLPDATAPGPLSGDMVLCVPVIQREAAEQGKALDAHFAHMIVHGMLHLQGYDHEEAHAADVMEGMETDILARLGYGNPYA
ncbi:MAG: rRNA maturation RNase YbeY [Rhodocyclales bacterium]|nr:rRNA maturation RNase YbeY [Rhodocyclales bacterium]